MNLKTLIKELDLFLPSPYSAEEKAIFLNKTISELSRFGGKSDILKIKGTGQGLYPLPYIEGECIEGVSVNGREYFSKGIYEEGDFFYIIMPDGFINIEPAPKPGDEIEIYHYALQPFKMQNFFESEEEFLSQEITLDTEYKYLLLYGAMADMSLSMEDSAMANNLREEFNILKRDALQGRYRKKGGYPKVKIADERRG